MLINGKKKIIILHVPKTGGRFRRKYNQHDFYAMDCWHIAYDNVNLSNHIMRNTITKPIIYATQEGCIEQPPIDAKFDINNYTVYTMVRNPYNRFVSGVKFKTLGDKKSIADNELSRLIDSELDAMEENPEMMDFKYKGYDDQNKNRLQIVMVPQSKWIGQNTIILKYESIDDWKILCDLLNIPIDNVKIKGDYTDKLTDKQRERIKKLYYGRDKQIFDLYNL